MTVSLVFDANSTLSVADLPALVDLVAFESPLYNLTPTSFTGIGTRYTGPGQPYGMDATFSVTGTGFEYISIGYGIVTAGIVQSSTITHQGTNITLTGANWDIEDMIPIFLAESNYTNVLGLETFLLNEEWDVTLSNNDDIAPRGSTVGDGAVFNLQGDDIIRGKGGDDDLFTGNGNDNIRGGSGDDRLDGGAGADRIYGGSGADDLIGANGADRLFGNSGQDEINAGRGNDRLFGGTGADNLAGGRGRDDLFGNGGNDHLDGGRSGDVLTGGRGNDVLVGGLGADDFVFRNGHGDDTIQDFNANNNAEDIDLSGVTRITSFADLTANHMVQNGADVVIDDGANLSITLLNVDINDLGAGDFIF